MAERRNSWRALVGALALASLMMLVVAVVRAFDPDETINVADLAAVLIAATVAATAVFTWSRLPRQLASALGPAQASKAAEVLVGLIRKQWEAEARHRSLDDPQPIPVCWKLTGNEAVMSQGRLVATQTNLTFDGRSDDIVAIAGQFRGLSRCRLVITGEPGMGKTTLAVQLLLQLLATRTQDQLATRQGKVLPIPVLLPLSGWDLNVHPRLQEWLVDRLAKDYPALSAPELGSGAVGALVAGGYILPVLDGLDEIAQHARPKVIKALNASLGSGDQLIMTSRTAEFTKAIAGAGRPLNGAAVIVPTRLSPQDAAAYLRACLPRLPSESWCKVLAALENRSSAALAETAATPLGLWLIRTVYADSGADPAELTGPLGIDRASLRAHLLDQLIPALIRTRTPSTDRSGHFRPRRRRDPDATRRHLTYLAQAFPPAITCDIAWWRIAASVPQIRHITGLVGGVVAATLGGVGAGLALGIAYGLVHGLVAALTFGLVFGLAVGIGHTCWADEEPGHANLRLRGRMRLLAQSVRRCKVASSVTRLKVMLPAALALGLTAFVTTGFEVGVATGLVAGPTFALTVEVAVGVVVWAEKPTLTSVSTAISSWKSDRTLTLMRGVPFGIPFGLACCYMVGLSSGLASGLTIGVATGLVFGVSAGLVFGLLMGRHHAWLVGVIASCYLALRGELPWRIMSFLDDAHRLGLLRAVGPIYQFRHADLHDHLAAVPSGGLLPETVGHPSER
ncbi:NACHT domain-containing protein [[Actinomadura] parvosata]|uniref:NACHT domain-containing protein n=1 Tax=[Actinomadura] parvosata TaxID=1955412 RepID=UPI001646AE08|nr:NACHT domain-containing protein [Nonomuraea sp. ATCC 55076]